jgi:2-dehydropantoate 2-reductase
MAKRIAIMGAGAVGGYVGAHLAKAGNDVTLIDFWHANVEAIRQNGVYLSGMTQEEEMAVPVNALHLHEVSGLSRQQPMDIMIISVKSYDTEWATTLVRPYLAPDGYVVSLQNCINEETIASVVGWGRTVGCIASRISVELYGPAQIRRQAPRGSSDHTVFRIGEVHGRITPRIEELAAMFEKVDNTKTTSNLWGERWSKLSHNSMRNGVSAATGLSSKELDQYELIRRFIISLGGEAVKVGRALGYELEKIGKLQPDLLASAGDGNEEAILKVDALMLSENEKSRGDLQRPSMGQDMIKGRPTEIDYLNGLVARKGKEIGIPTPANAVLTALVKRVERGEIPASPNNILAI